MTTNEKRNLLSSACRMHAMSCEGCKLHDADMCINISSATAKEIDERYALVFSGSRDSESDNVNHPMHYQGAHECIEVMKAMFGVEAVKAFCRCNAFKYRFRAGMKNGEEDIRKAEWYEDYLIKLIEQEDGNDTD